MRLRARWGTSRRACELARDVEHVRMTDVLRDVGDDLLARPGRTLLTALGTFVGIAVLVGALGLAASLDSQIGARFAAIAPREVSVTPASQSRGIEQAAVMPWDGPARAHRIRGVQYAANFSELAPERPVLGSPVHDPTRPVPRAMRVYAASPEVFETIGASLVGTVFTGFNDQRSDAVAVLGRDAAVRLGISDVRGRPVLFVDGFPVVVIGIIEGVERQSIVLNSILIPECLARDRFGLTAPSRLIVLTSPGASAVVAHQLPLAVRPQGASEVIASVPPTAEVTREAVASDAQGLLLALAAVSIFVGGVGIANVTLVSVLQRTAEIGLRRAVGARRRDIVAHFLVSSTLVGSLGAVLGTCCGVWVTLVVALAQGWPPTIDRWVLVVGPVVGALTGLVAGAYPSYRASSIEPIEALRVGV